MKNSFENPSLPENRDFSYEILSNIETRREIKERMDELIKEIKLQHVDVVVFLDRSARPLSWLFREMWETEEGHPIPKIKFVNVGQQALLHKGSKDILATEGHSVYEGWSDSINDIIPDKIREGTWINGNDLLELWKKGVSEKTGLINELKSAFKHEFDGKKILILDDCAATGLSQLAAVGLFDVAFPEAEEISATQFFQSTRNYEKDLKRLPWLQKTGVTGVLEKREHSMFSAPITEERLRELHNAQLEVIEKKGRAWRKEQVDYAKKQWDIPKEEASRLNKQLRSEMKQLAIEHFQAQPKKRRSRFEQEDWMNWLNME